MPRGEIVILITGTQEFKDVARKLKEAGNGKLTRKLRAKMRKAAEPMLTAAKANVTGIKSGGSWGGGTAARAEHTAMRSKRLSPSVQRRIREHSGLRARVAFATRVEVNTSKNPQVRLRTSTSQMPANQRKLPVHLNTGKWRHPTWGNREAWVTQTATPEGWFSRAVHEHAGKVRDGAEAAVNDINAEIG